MQPPLLNTPPPTPPSENNTFNDNFEGLTEKQARELATVMVFLQMLQDEKEGKVSSEQPEFVDKTIMYDFESMPTYDVDIEEGIRFTNIVRNGTPEEVYKFRKSMNKRQFSLYYAVLDNNDKNIFWDKYSDYEAEQLVKGHAVANDTPPRSLEKFMNKASNEQIYKLMKNLPDNYVLEKGKAISANRMTRKDRAKLFKQKYTGVLAKSARTRRAAGEVPSPYVAVPPTVRRLGVPEPAPQPSIEEQLLGYSNEEKAEFKRHIMNNEDEALNEYFSKLRDRQRIFNSLNEESKATYKRKMDELAMRRLAARLGQENSISNMGTRKNIAAKYINSLTDEEYAAIKGKLSVNGLQSLSAVYPLMTNKTRRANLINKTRVDAYKERQAALSAKSTVENELRENEKEISLIERLIREAEELLKTANADTITRLTQRITTLRARLAFLQALIPLGRSVISAVTAYLRGESISAAWHAAWAAYQGYSAKAAYNKVKEAEAAEAPKEEEKSPKRIRSMNNLKKAEADRIFVNVAIEFDKLHDKTYRASPSSKILKSQVVEGQRRKCEVKKEGDAYYLYLFDNRDEIAKAAKSIIKGRNAPAPKELVVKRLVPLPTVDKAVDKSKMQKIEGQTIMMSHRLTYKTMEQSVQEMMPGAKAVPPKLWVNISYEADIYSNENDEIFVWFLNNEDVGVPIFIIDRSWEQI